jgi:maleamate amidohydrolase
VEERSDLVRDYAEAGFGAALSPGARPILLIIDFAMAYLTKGSPLFAGVEAELETNIRLVQAARAADVPVAFTLR